MFAHTRLPILVLCLALLAALWVSAPAQGADKVHPQLKKAIEKGRELWRTPKAKGAKSCVACHMRGPNKLTLKRVRAYPKYDKAMKKVVTLQQKLNQMIKSKSKGEPLELGSDDLNALEAFLNTLK